MVHLAGEFSPEFGQVNFVRHVMSIGQTTDYIKNTGLYCPAHLAGNPVPHATVLDCVPAPN